MFHCVDQLLLNLHCTRQIRLDVESRKCRSGEVCVLLAPKQWIEYFNFRQCWFSFALRGDKHSCAARYHLPRLRRSRVYAREGLLRGPAPPEGLSLRVIPYFGSKATKIDQNPSKIDQNRPKSTQIGPKWVKIGQNRSK